MHCQVWFPKGTRHYFTQKQQRIFSTAWFTLPQNKKTYLTSGMNYVQVQTIQGNVCLQSSQPICIPYSGDGDSGIGSKPHYPICGTNPQEFGYMYVIYIYINNYKYIFIFIYILDKFIYIYIYYNPYNYDHKPTLLPLFCDTAVQHNSTGPKQGRQAGEVHVICGRSKNYRSCAYAGAWAVQNTRGVVAFIYINI